MSDIEKLAAEGAADRARINTASMLDQIERGCGTEVALAVVEATIRAAAEWISSRVGPRTAYCAVQIVTDDMALHIAEHAARRAQGG